MKELLKRPDQPHVLSHCPALYQELRQFRSACADAHMKTILAVGDLDSFTTVYKASLVSMMAGQSHDSLSFPSTFPVCGGGVLQ